MIKTSIKMKVKVKLHNHTPHDEDVIGGWRYRATYSLTSELDGGEW
jgi:hypothetical protein